MFRDDVAEQLELYSASHSQVLQARAEPWGWQQDYHKIYTDTTRWRPEARRAKKPAAQMRRSVRPREERLYGRLEPGFHSPRHARRADRFWRGGRRMALAGLQDHDQRMSTPATLEGLPTWQDAHRMKDHMAPRGAKHRVRGLGHGHG